MQSLNLLHTLVGHQERVWHVTWDKRGKELASCSSDKTIRIWGKQGDPWICKTRLEEGHQRTIRKLAWSPCGNRLASASFDSTVGIWERQTGEFDCSASLEGHENEVKGIDWSVSSSYLATSSRDKTVWIWDAYEEDFECAGVLTSHKQDVKDVKWNPNEDILASCSYDDTINIYEEDDGEWITADTLTGHESTVWAISWDKTGNMLASVSDDKTVKIWKRYKPNNTSGVPVVGGKKCMWKCICTLSGYHERTIYSVDWCHKTGMIATAGADNCIRIFKEDIESGDSNEPVYSLVYCNHAAHEQDINSVAWNPVEIGLLASASDDYTIKLWKIPDYL